VSIIQFSDVPLITLKLGDPALLRWEDETGYLELEIGSISADDQVVNDLEAFWSGKWREWQYGNPGAQYVVCLELDRSEVGVAFRLDYHHMKTHVGIERTTTVKRVNRK
jgi:hypothetical protein